MQNKNTHGDEFAPEDPVNPAPGPAQTPTAPCIDDDVEAIRELLDQISRLWTHLTARSREDLNVWLELLRAAADCRDTDSKPVREALQQVLLSVGTGALATLGEATRQRLAALTGIALPGDRALAGRPGGTASARWSTRSAFSPESGGDG